MLLKDKCMCLQDEWKLQVTRPAGQVQFLNIFVPCTDLISTHISLKVHTEYSAVPL